MDNWVIRAENLGKKFTIGHHKTTDLRNAFGARLKKLFTPNISEKEEFWALKDVSFEVKKGEAMGIIGRNGAGKSTLLKMLSRITAPSTGRFEINGRVSSLLEVGTGFHMELTGRENIYLNGTILGMKRSEIKAKFDEIVAFSGVDKFIDTPVKHYSSGMKVRLAFSVAAYLEPEILIIDEVLAVGDAEFQKKCLGKMEDVTGQGRTVLFVSHNMGAIKKLCQTCILLKNGALDYQGDVNSTIEKYLDHNSSDKVELDNEFVHYAQVKQLDNDLKLIVKVKNFANKIHEPNLGFIIKNSLGEPIIGSNPKLAGASIPSFAGSEHGIVTALIKSHSLRSGSYNISIWLGDGEVDYFEGIDILKIYIENRLYQRKDIDPSIVGYIRPNVEWQVD